MRRLLRIWFIVMINIVAPAAVFGATYIWTGGTNTDWTNSGNWSPPSIFSPALPVNTDDIIIGPTVFNLIPPARYPVIKAGENIICNSLTFSELPSPTITVNGTLTVTNALQQNHHSGSNVSCLITGTGTINCASFIIGDTTTPGAFSGNLFTTTVKVNITQLTVSGATTVNSASTTTKTNNAVLTIANDNGACTVSTRSLGITTPSPIATTLASATLTNSSTGAITLKLTGSTPISIANTTYGSIDFNTGSGTGSTTVEYARATAQTVYTEGTTGINTSPALYQHLSFSGGGTKTINSGNLTISGNWTSSGGTIDCTLPNIIFKGTTQTLTDNGSGTGNIGPIFKSVTFQGGGTKTISGASASPFSVSSTGLLTMAASSTLAVGTNGSLTLISDASGAASVAAIPTGCSITGSVNVQRYFRAGTIATNTRNYRLLSSPVNATGTTNNSTAVAYYNLAFLNNNPGVFVAGPGGVTNGFTVANASPTIYLYKESLPASNTTFNSGNFKGIANIAGSSTVTAYSDDGTTANVNATLYAGNGYMLYYCGNNTASVTSTTVLNKQFRVGGSYIDPDAATTTAAGTLNQGDIPVKLWATGSTTLPKAQTGFNLVGNPYASTIDWDTFSNTSSSAAIYGPNVGKAIYVFNYTNKNYGTYQAGGGTTGTNNASRYIASGQGFFVVASAASGASLTFKEAAKTTTQPSSLGSSFLLMSLPAQANAAPQTLRLKLAKDTINTDEAIIMFEGNSQNAFEADNDAPRLNGIGNVATLATYASDATRQLAINHAHSIDSTTRIKLYVNSSAGGNTLTFTGLSSLDVRYDAYLIDHYKKDSVKISESAGYAFNIRTDSAASYGTERFELAFHKKSSLNYRLISFTGTVNNGSIDLKWKTANEQDMTGFIIEKAEPCGTYKQLYSAQSDGSGFYSFTDKMPSVGKNHYRLRQSDAFDRITYSDATADINLNGMAPQVVTVYPNPVTTQFSVRLNVTDVPEKVLLKVFDTNGLLKASSLSDGNNIQQNVSSLTPGTYMVELRDNYTKRVIGWAKISKPQ